MVTPLTLDLAENLLAKIILKYLEQVRALEPVAQLSAVVDASCNKNI